MSNTYTIRPTEDESNDVQVLMKHLKVGHASKALLKAAKELPSMANDYYSLMIRHQNLVNEHSTLKEAIKQKELIDNSIKEIVNK